MDDDDMDSAMLREAIAASLRDTKPKPRSDVKPSKDFVDLTNESDGESEVEEVHPKSKPMVGSVTDDEAGQDDEEDIKRAIELSLRHAQPDTQATEKEEPKSPQKSSEISTPLGILGLDRKLMEQERLARLAKRKADTSASPPGQSPAKVAKIEKVEESPTPYLSISSMQPLTRTPTPKPSTPQICDRPPANDPSFRVQPTARPLPQWPFGAVKKTYVSNKPRTGDDITIEEVLQRGDVELAVLSSFLWDTDWIFKKFDMRRTRFYLIMHAKEESTVGSLLRKSSCARKLTCHRDIASSVRRRNAPHAQYPLVFPPNGWPGELHAF